MYTGPFTIITVVTVCMICIVRRAHDQRMRMLRPDERNGQSKEVRVERCSKKSLPDTLISGMTTRAPQGTMHTVDRTTLMLLVIALKFLLLNAMTFVLNLCETLGRRQCFCIISRRSTKSQIRTSYAIRPLTFSSQSATFW